MKTEVDRITERLTMDDSLDLQTVEGLFEGSPKTVALRMMECTPRASKGDESVVCDYLRVSLMELCAMRLSEVFVGHNVLSHSHSLYVFP